MTADSPPFIGASPVSVYLTDAIDGYIIDRARVYLQSDVMSKWLARIIHGGVDFLEVSGD